MIIRTVTDSTIKLSGTGAVWLKYVIPCGRDWIAEIKICNAGRTKTPDRARVFVSQNPGVAELMNLAHNRGELEIR